MSAWGGEQTLSCLANPSLSGGGTDKLMYAKDVPAGTVFYHGTKADLTVGDLLGPGFGSNFVERGLKHIYFTATLEAATWGAELAKGRGADGSTS